MTKYWLVKIAFMFLALAGVLWLIGTLKSGAVFSDPQSPAQLILGLPPAAPGSNQSPREGGIPAKVITQPPKAAQH